MGETNTLLTAILERLDVQGAHLEQMKLDLSQLKRQSNVHSELKGLPFEMAELKEDLNQVRSELVDLMKEMAMIKQGLTEWKSLWADEKDDAPIAFEINTTI